MSDICKEYGEALFALGLEENLLDTINSDLEFVSEVFEKNPEYIAFLQSPNIPKAQRLETVEKVFRDGVSEYIQSFLSILCEKRRVSLFNECAGEFNKLYNESKNVSVARVFSAIPLSESQKDRLKQKLEKQSGHSVTLECSIDDTLLGGIKIIIDGTEIDGTLRHRLQELKEVMDK